jgi:2-keto-3-deoxy-6-phosphogluconate aldolase
VNEKSSHPGLETEHRGVDGMKKQIVLDLIKREKLIPVVRVSAPQEAMEVAEAVKAGGVSLIEITMTVGGAMDVIEELNRKHGDGMIIGAGTVLGVGGELIDKKAVADKRFEVITENARAFLKAIREAGEEMMKGR